jgi:hypothetical protein
MSHKPAKAAQKSITASNQLSFTGLPPIDVPFRYFMTAPLFAIAVALMIFVDGDHLWISRWQNQMLAITHAFTLGFIASIMLGALFQLLPVTAGISIGKPRLVAGFCHSLHTLGSILLIVGFLINEPLIQLSAAIILALGFTFYLVVLGYFLLKDKLSKHNTHTNFTLSTIKLALVALLITVCLGLLLQTKIIGLSIITWNKDFTNLHATWGLNGWVALLIMAISFQVLPMFHVAPEFPRWVKRFLPRIIFSVLIALFATKFIVTLHFLKEPLKYLLLILNGVFIFYLLTTLHNRKRKIADSTVNYWRLAALNLLLCSVLFIVPEQILPLMLLQKLPILLAVLFIFGYVVSVLQGMLLKILPFLVFTHLQQRCMINFTAMQALPNMHEILSKRHGQIQFILHLFTLVILLITVLFPQLYPLLASLLLAEFLWLSFLINKAYYLYKRHHNTISQLL